MKIIVKTLKGNKFPVEVLPTDTASEVKKNIESVQGADVYPASQQVLIHQGKVLKDDTTMLENNIAENSFVVIMMSKSKSSSVEGSEAATSKAPSTAGSARSAEASIAPPAAVTSVPIPASQPVSAPAAVVVPAPESSPTPASGDVYSQAASNLIAGSGLEQTVQQILDMGGGTWDRDTVMRALRAAFNNPERAIDYLYSGIPEQAEIPPPSQPVVAAQPTTAPSVAQQPTQPAPLPSSGPNANPLNLFPQGLPNLTSGGAGTGALDFLRSEQFQALRAMVQANPQILQPMLQELGKQNPQLVRLIQENQNEFLQLMNEPADGEEGNVLDQLAGAMPQTIEVTPEERDAIERLEAMGFDRATVLEVFFACNKDEMLAANYLLDHMHELQD